MVHQTACLGIRGLPFLAFWPWASVSLSVGWGWVLPSGCLGRGGDACECLILAGHAVGPPSLLAASLRSGVAWEAQGKWGAVGGGQRVWEGVGPDIKVHRLEPGQKSQGPGQEAEKGKC